MLQVFMFCWVKYCCASCPVVLKQVTVNYFTCSVLTFHCVLHLLIIYVHVVFSNMYVLLLLLLGGSLHSQSLMYLLFA